MSTPDRIKDKIRYGLIGFYDKHGTMPEISDLLKSLYGTTGLDLESDRKYRWPEVAI